jgi:hypothetical protein
MSHVSNTLLTGAPVATVQVTAADRAPSSPSTTRAVVPAAADAASQPADVARPGPRDSRAFGPLRPREGEAAPEAPEADRTDAPRAPEPQTLADLWRSRFDSETLRMFTEVVDPVTREAMYRVPPNRISEEAEEEGRDLAKRERMRMEQPLVI